MKKLEVLYIFLVFVFIAIFSNMSYSNVGHLSFWLPAVTILTVIGIIASLLLSQDKWYVNLWFWSYFLVVLMTFLPIMKPTIKTKQYLYGYPFNWFVHHKSGFITIEFFQFLANVLLFYLFIRFIIFLWSKLNEGNRKTSNQS